ncbi:MAG TPA: phosphoribosylaminoimidazolesuccinocarboxamide synthase, partial [Rhodothermales bacterium]
MSDVLLESALPNRTYRGKVRDTYDLGDKMLIIATDRISAADMVLPAGIPQKGRILTQLSAWWFERMKEVVPNHFIAVVTEANKHLVPFELG